MYGIVKQQTKLLKELKKIQPEDKVTSSLKFPGFCLKIP